jgi:transcriptional regulator with XRE-family HTH domain
MTDNKMIKKELGAHIRAIRRRRGLTQEEMADKCGLHWTYIGGLERGERNPTLTTMERIARGLGVSVVDLMVKPTEDPGNLTPREREEARLMRFLHKKDAETLQLAGRVLREVVGWRDRYGVKKK